MNEMNTVYSEASTIVFQARVMLMPGSNGLGGISETVVNLNERTITSWSPLRKISC